MSIDPLDVFRRFGEVNTKITEEQHRSEYLRSKFTIKVQEFMNECRGRDVKPAELDVLRNQSHDLLDQWFDSMASQKMLAEKFANEIKNLSPDNPTG